MNTQSPKPDIPVPDRRKTRAEDREEYFNSQFEQEPIYIGPRQSVWSKDKGDMIVATVGSGVLITIYDKDLRLSAVGYVLIPDELIRAFPHFNAAHEQAMKKAVQPIIDCIDHMKRGGAAKKRLWLRLIGGASLPGYEDDRGTKNQIQNTE